MVVPVAVTVVSVVDLDGAPVFAIGAEDLVDLATGVDIGTFVPVLTSSRVALARLWRR
jgi:hypothetical protein